MQRQNTGGGGKNSGLKSLLKDQEERIKKGCVAENPAMYRDAESADEVAVYLEGTASLLDDLRKLTSLKVNNVAIVKANNNPSCLGNVQMIDLKLNVFGPIEDDVYALFPLLVKNIRRGNTVLKIDKDDEDSTYTIGRKGLEKFFDLRYEFISPEQRYDENCLPPGHHMQKNYILAGPLKAIKAGNKVEVLKTLKANGENVQVSWSADVEAWVICSKNVALLAAEQTQVDADKYSPPRFVFAKEMAHVWFKKIAAIKKERGDKAVQELKADLTGKTLIGEYVGSQEHQHLVKYSRVTIIFYAVVENMSSQDCIPCDKAWELFDKWGLDKVAIQTLGLFDDYSTMCDSLCRVFKDVAKSEIAEEEEGNVLYFVNRPAKEGEEGSEILSLCKLKTLEYRLFRKMREKLRNFYARPIDERTADRIATISKRFISEAKELSEEHDLPRSLKYYVALFKTAFKFLDQDPYHVDLLTEEYVTFSEKLLQYFSKEHGDETFAQNSNFFFSPILDVQDDIKYGQGNINAYALRSKLSEESGRKKSEDLTMFDDNEEEKKEAPNNKQVKGNTSFASKVKSTDSEARAKKTIILIIPFGVPGSGKSFIWKLLKQKIESMPQDQWTCDSISSDGIRGELMEKLIKNQGISRDEAYRQTQRQGPQTYTSDVKSVIKKASSLSSKTGATHVIFLDKNHPNDKGIDIAISTVMEGFTSQSITIKKLFLVPEMSTDHQFVDAKNNQYPFTENFLAEVYAWGQNRTDHATLNNDDPCKMAEIQTMFIKMSSGVTYDATFLNINGLDGFLRLPMSIESFTIPEELSSQLKHMITSFKGVSNDGPRKHVEAFIAELKKNSEILNQFVDKDLIVTKAMEQLTQCRDGEGSSSSPATTSKAKTNRNRKRNKGQESSENTPTPISKQVSSDGASVRKVIDTNKQQHEDSQATVKMQKPGKTPTFLGINIESDPQFSVKLKSLFNNVFSQAGEPKEMIAEFDEMVRTRSQTKTWKLPNSYHVTSLFIGGNKQKLRQPQFEFHQEGKAVPVQIRAIIYVPNQLVCGVCFPECEIENEFPHLTLMVSSGWSPVMSNAVIQATCKKNKVFEQAYLAANDGLLPAKGAGVHSAIDVQIEKKGKQEVVFVLLREPITFDGYMRAYY